MPLQRKTVYLNSNSTAQVQRINGRCTRPHELASQGLQHGSLTAASYQYIHTGNREKSIRWNFCSLVCLTSSKVSVGHLEDAQLQHISEAQKLMIRLQ